MVDIKTAHLQSRPNKRLYKRTVCSLEAGRSDPMTMSISSISLNVVGGGALMYALVDCMFLVGISPFGVSNATYGN